MQQAGQQAETKTYRIYIKGLVQGVGFRPFVYREAVALNLRGTVENRNDGVYIEVSCTLDCLENFIHILHSKAPPASAIESITYEIIDARSFEQFSIIKSSSKSDSITEISPDIAVCADCLEDMKTQTNRIDYPFINCTNCGPRFTIIRDLPYDRAQTTMQPFLMCDSCASEYTDILDRRFHAQPVACMHCGPAYTLYEGQSMVAGHKHIFERMAQLIDGGHTVAVKGLGGYFMACNALDEAAVAALRKSKHREGKPFAVMFKSLEVLKTYALVNGCEEESLLSFRRPIVLLTSKKSLAPAVAVGFNTLGVMLPYMPVHYLLFEKLNTPAIVLTSGNISDEPIIIDDGEALNKLGPLSSAVLTCNREIFNRADDSVVRIMNGRERLFRRSRGFAPAPLGLPFDAEGLLAAGAELMNCFAIGKSDKVFLSQHTGDLKNFETYTFFRESLSNFSRMFRFKPTFVVCDLHPDYLSTRYAHETGLPRLGVQHHHAHIASCMAENGLDEKVIGVALDGTGYGSDGHIWGSEFMVCDYDGFDRITHFEYIPLPGGDKVTDEPWRIAVSYLYKYYGKDFISMQLSFLKGIAPDAVHMLCHAIENNINCPLSSGAGRLFDAVSALTGLCTVSAFHAEAPMRLEAAIAEGVSDTYPYEIQDVVVFRKTFEAILTDMSEGIPQGVIAARFHNTLAEIINELCVDIRTTTGLNAVALSGGTFQNKYLSELTENKLRSSGFRVYVHTKVPAGDGGIALGQIALGAAYKRNK